MLKALSKYAQVEPTDTASNDRATPDGGQFDDR